jgi:hypothetical protein
MSNELHSRYVPNGMTRDCTDPWTYVEFSTDGGIKPCCVRASIGNLKKQPLADILHSPAARELRLALLTGEIDGICRSCGLRGIISSSALQQKIRSMRDALQVPSGFDTTAYLEANPDVRTAGVDPKLHYLEWGRLEGRLLRTNES